MESLQWIQEPEPPDRGNRLVVVALFAALGLGVLLTLWLVSNDPATVVRTVPQSVAGGSDSGSPPDADEETQAAESDGADPAGGQPATETESTTSESADANQADGTSSPVASRTDRESAGDELAEELGAGGRARFGRYTVFGEGDPGGRRQFGESVAIDGDVAAAVAHYARNSGKTSTVHVFERGPEGWVETQEIAPPEYTERGPYWVGIGDRRIVTAGGTVLGTTTRVLRSYVRSNSDGWTLESEHAVPTEPDKFAGATWCRSDGFIAALGTYGYVATWARKGGTWTHTGLNRPAKSLSTTAPHCWTSALGDSLVVFGNAKSASNATIIDIRREGERVRRGRPTVVDHNVNPQTRGALVDGGRVLVTTSPVGELRIYQREAGDWSLAIKALRPRASVSGVTGYAAVGADRDLVVVAVSQPEHFLALVGTGNRWQYAELHVPDRFPGRGRETFTNGASVAVSRRSVIVGTHWDDISGGRVVLFDVPNRAVPRWSPVEPVARPAEESAESPTPR